MPITSSLQQLKETVARLIPCSPSSLRLSLNQNDEILAFSPHQPLRSLGITSGDLIFFSLLPSLQTPTDSVSPNRPTHSEASNVQGPSRAQISNLDLNLQSHSSDMSLSVSSVETMESDGGSCVLGLNKCHEFDFLRKVLRDELGQDCSPIKAMVIGVHAVFLESGFVRFDSVSGIRVDPFQFPDEWFYKYSKLSVYYTLPVLANRGNTPNSIQTIQLKFQPMGHILNVYGSMGDSNSGYYRLSLEGRFVASLISLMTDDDYNGVCDREVYNFWKIVKDTLVYPLSINMCEKAGLVPPPCLASLPSELKMKILGFLPGADIAKVGCVCKELRNLSDNNELWKLKFCEEFGSSCGNRVLTWKEGFVLSWESKKVKSKITRPRWLDFEVSPTFPPRRTADPFPSAAPLIGGLPSLPGERDIRCFRIRRYGNISPNCNLGFSFN